ncbi:hypothetical protein [Thiorhodospira sibirica]|uniref:hypothetical protein n=1 Tax=Thiorhodospira sibirica TaxID=154347 RepID=UPI00022C4C98|nr:hypothetical protein [Thiorhodospira sibirica]
MRLGRFTHLDSERILALVLKMQWERYYLEAKPPSSGSLLDALPHIGADDQRLLLKFQPGAGRTLDIPALYALFEQQGHLASGAGYHEEPFRVLVHRLIQVHGQLHASDSPELLAFVAHCRTERQLLAAANDSEQERFWRTKLMWMSADQELGNQLLELENQRLRNANLHQRWLATFGEDLVGTTPSASGTAPAGAPCAFLRSCLETTASSQAVSHQSTHCEINPGFAARHQALVVLAQTA